MTARIIPKTFSALWIKTVLVQSYVIGLSKNIFKYDLLSRQHGCNSFNVEANDIRRYDYITIIWYKT